MAHVLRLAALSTVALFLGTGIERTADAVGSDGGTLAGIALIITATCTGIASLVGVLRKRRERQTEDDDLQDQARKIAALLLAQRLLEEEYGDRRGRGADDGNRRRHDD